MENMFKDVPPTIDQMWDCLVNHPDLLPVSITTLASIMQISEDECTIQFIKHAIYEHGPVTFRYPPLPCAAITSIGHPRTEMERRCRMPLQGSLT